MHDSCAYLLVNFGGPRDLLEVESFLTTLLTDKETIRTHFPSFIHDFLFKKIAKKRAKKIIPEYQLMGGCSPIFFDTEWIKQQLRTTLASVVAYHRFLPKTHQESFHSLKKIEEKHIIVFPLYPQFSYATTGSAAKHLFDNLPKSITQKMVWIKSYALHPVFIALFQKKILAFFLENNLKEEETILFFSAHGLPKIFVDEGDPYQKECEQSFFAIKQCFPYALSCLGYQSKFGRGEWLQPYTNELCASIHMWGKGKKNVIFIPLSFTSDHIETLVEIETLYLPIVKKQGFQTYRLPSFNRDADWVEGIKKMMQPTTCTPIQMLLRKKY